MNQASIQKFIQLISLRTGLYVRFAEVGALQEKLFSRMRALGLRSLDAYYQVLERASIPETREWQELIDGLTVTESYFFRDSGQFDLLKNTILPSLIEQKRKSSRIPKLKIWSAACSSGEEPYSLAILLRELLPDLSRWEISILGTDINQNILEKAKQGVYGNWSFRAVEPMVQKRYFTRTAQGWKIDNTIRDMVKFKYLNLVTDRFPDLSLGLANIDLILCRNVFIYFEAGAIERVLKKFYHTLQPGGYLMSAHAELPDRAIHQLQTLIFPNSAIYRKTETSPPISPIVLNPPLPVARVPLAPPTPCLPPSRHQFSPPTSNRRKSPTQSVSSLRSTPGYRSRKVKPLEIGSLIKEAATLLDRGAYPETIQVTQHILKVAPDCLKAYLLIAQAYANLGEYQKATYYCVQALALDTNTIESYYLLARIAEVQGNLPKAKNLLQQIIYLDSEAVFAYLELAAVYRKEKKLSRATKMEATALKLLGSLPSRTIVDPIARLTAGDVLEQVAPMPSVP